MSCAIKWRLRQGGQDRPATRSFGLAPIRTYLLAIAIFVSGVKGQAAWQLSRDLDVQNKTAFVLSHKLRKAMATETADATLGDAEGAQVEVNGA